MNCNYLAAVEVVVKVGLLAEAAAAVGTHHLLAVVRHLGARGQVPPSYTIIIIIIIIIIIRNYILYED